MKTIHRLFALAALTLFTGVGASGQCTPDTANCKDTGLPGQICPRNLPEVTVNVPYDEVVTVLAPPLFVFGGDTIEVAYITEVS